MNSLLSLRRHSALVADTAEYLQLDGLPVQDATTNPSLVLRAIQHPDYAALARSADVAAADDVDLAMDRLLVRFGCEILQRIPGRVSTEIDARLSHDAAASVQRARRLIALYEAAGVPRSRVLIKLASTWDGIVAARQLQADGIACNMTLLFAFVQARACAGLQLISPFVGRITDWHKQQAGAAWDAAAMRGAADPGVQALVRIWRFYKARGVSTEVMGASFRDTAQLTALAGCDLLTVSPSLLQQLAADTAAVPRQLDPAAAGAPEDLDPLHPDQATFRAAMAADPMASSKLDQGIAAFCADTDALLALLRH